MTLYTDGSFQNGATSFVLVKSTAAGYEAIRELRLPDNTGIFIAEIAAIETAISYSKSMNQRSVICTDSLRATMALGKNRNGLYNNILQQKLKQPILILWIPSHIGVQGNVQADNAAKRAVNITQLYKALCFSKAITNSFRISRKAQNPMCIGPRYNPTLTRNQCVTLTHLRADKAKFNTKHY